MNDLTAILAEIDDGVKKSHKGGAPFDFPLLLVLADILEERGLGKTDNLRWANRTLRRPAMNSPECLSWWGKAYENLWAFHCLPDHLFQAARLLEDTFQGFYEWTSYFSSPSRAYLALAGVRPEDIL